MTTDIDLMNAYESLSCDEKIAVEDALVQYMTKNVENFDASDTTREHSSDWQAGLDIAALAYLGNDAETLIKRGKMESPQTIDDPRHYDSFIQSFQNLPIAPLCPAAEGAAIS